MSTGYLSLVLHAHLPFVRHPEHEHFLEERWLFEAITECYLPLLDMLQSLHADAIPVRITMSITPTLVSMLTDPLLQRRYLRHLDGLIELSEKEIRRTASQAKLNRLAQRYHASYCRLRWLYTGHFDRDLITAFNTSSKTGMIDIIASCATHGFLPALAVDPRAVSAQIRIGVQNYRSAFGRNPQGFWLPECGFFPGLDKELKEAGIDYFFTDSHGLLNADPAPHFGVYAPILAPGGASAFGRDPDSSRQVWSSQEGYPGDPVYREYYRDIGHELDINYLGKSIGENGLRLNTGIKYCRITGTTDAKELYDPLAAGRRALVHARDFLKKREAQALAFFNRTNRPAIIVAPFDAELFGHWWYEGPQWINALFREMALSTVLKPATPGDYLKNHPILQVAMPSASTWGNLGYSDMWVNGTNAWIYRHLHGTAERMKELAEKVYAEPDGGNQSSLIREAADQACRELLLAQASDWPFIMKTGTTVAYARRRVNRHIHAFNRLHKNIVDNSILQKEVDMLRQRDNIFSDIPCASYYLSTDTGNKPIVAGTKKIVNKAEMIPASKRWSRLKSTDQVKPDRRKVRRK